MGGYINRYKLLVFMSNLNINNIHLAYQAVYDETLCESIEDLGLIGDYDKLNEGHSKLKLTDSDFRRHMDIPDVPRKKEEKQMKAITSLN